MPEDERPRRGCAAAARTAARSAKHRRRRRQSPSPGRLKDALARNGCGGGQMQQSRREQRRRRIVRLVRPRRQRRGGPGSSSRSIAASIRTVATARSACGLCDGFFFPISYATYASHLAEDARDVPVELRGAGGTLRLSQPRQEISQAISLNGAAYAALPNAFRYRKEYVKGCSCKEAEYSPTEIEASGQKAEGRAGNPARRLRLRRPAPKPPRLPPTASGRARSFNADGRTSPERRLRRSRTAPDAAEAASRAPQEPPPAAEAREPDRRGSNRPWSRDAAPTRRGYSESGGLTPPCLRAAPRAAVRSAAAEASAPAHAPGRSARAARAGTEPCL